MATFKVTSNNQSGGVNAGQINGPEPQPPRRPRWRLWQLVVAVSVVVGGLASIAQILGYLKIVP